MPTASSYAAVADALVPAALLAACKYPLLLFAWRRMRRGDRADVAAAAATWIGRGAAVLAILPGLRLVALGTQGGAIAPGPLGIGLAILSLTAAAMLADDLLVSALRRVPCLAPRMRA